MCNLSHFLIVVFSLGKVGSGKSANNMGICSSVRDKNNAFLNTGKPN